MKKAIIVGARTYGQVYAEYLKSQYSICGYIDDDPTLENSIINGIPVLGSVNYLLDNIGCDEYSVFVPIGNNDVRYNILKRLNTKGFQTPSFIHPNTQVFENVSIGNAVYMLPNSLVMPCTVIKDYTMISAGVNIAHHNIIEKGCFFSQGSNIGASLFIDTKAYVGISATIMTGVKRIGSNTLIGAGAVVISDVEDNAVVVGIPAKTIKYR